MFIDQLADRNAELEAAWRSAFRDVPRDAFVPHYFVQSPNKPGWRLVEQPSDEWLRGVYSMDALITQIDGDDGNADRARSGHVNGVATSSSSAPTLMALMLQAL